LARYDKYDPYSGGFRAQLAADFGTAGNGAQLGQIYAVGLNTSGQVVKGAGNTGVVGLLVLTLEKYALDVVDVMTHGEIVDIATATPFDNFQTAGVAALSTAGTKYYGHAAADGALDTVVTANYAIGWTAERNRLIVRVGGHLAAS
jgi:hypothetical protein